MKEICPVELICDHYGFTLDIISSDEDWKPRWRVYDCRDGLNELNWVSNELDVNELGDLLDAIKDYFYVCGAESAIR